ncbi:YEATS domain-containing protein 2-like [Saccoglossus kowalevskii]|uniref:YEATS domain-containing protein 2-like n=1 Tax=Saccoglossus kowalevskii TaxID=10224 RepID=A0ABM0GPM2_SACKO|nr:PREDICTED: YEATS domain-containing protein 2-like [Saccoglossus kowalevskii]
MASKRGHQDQDPDYLDDAEPRKLQRRLEEGAKEATVKRMESIIKQQFNIEMKNKEKEIDLIDQRIHQVRSMLDRLRACVVATYYGMAGQNSNGEIDPVSEKNGLHPTVQKVIEKSSSTVALETSTEDGESREIEKEHDEMEIDDIKPTGAKGPRNIGQDTFGVPSPLPRSKTDEIPTNTESSRFHVKKRIVVGNISKYIPPDKREENDPSTHKWMAYVRGPLEEPRIDHFVKKVWFFLHPSYRPNDLVEVSEPPFHLTRRGWGEFPVRVQLHFVDPRNKKVDIIHNLKLDRTYTGLQTLGAETVVDVELDRYSIDEIQNTTHITKQANHDISEPIGTLAISEGSTVAHTEDIKPNINVAMLDQDTTAPPLNAAQIAARISAAQQLCTPRSGKSQYSKKNGQEVMATTGNTVQDGSKLVSKASTSVLSIATGTLSMPPLGPIGSAKNPAAVTVVTNTVTSTVKPNVNVSANVQHVQANVQQVHAQKQLSLKNASSGNFVMLTTAPQVAGSATVSTPSSNTMATKVWINQGKVQMSSPGVVAVGNVGVKSKPTSSLQITSQQSIGGGKVMQGKTITKMATPSRPAPKAEIVSPTVIQTQPGIIATAPARPTGQAAVAMPTAIAVPTGVTMTGPGVAMGTQYFIAAKSTDPSLQGKMILIPHQALIQATGQRLVASVTQQIPGQNVQNVRLRGATGQGPRMTSPGQVIAGKNAPGMQRVSTPQIQGKVPSAQIRGQSAQVRGQTVQVRGAFPIPPGNVILIPQGANIPGIQPGSIVQIQQTLPVSKAPTVSGKPGMVKATTTGAPMKTAVQITPASSTTILPISGAQQNTTLKVTSTGITAQQPIPTPSRTVLMPQNAPAKVLPGTRLVLSQPAISNLSQPAGVLQTSSIIGNRVSSQAIKVETPAPDHDTDTVLHNKGTAPVKLRRVIPVIKPEFAIPSTRSIATTKIALTEKPPAVNITKPTTTFIGPRLPVSTVRQKLKDGCLAMSKTISLDKVQSIEDIVHTLIKRNPLINKHRVQHEHPFCALSYDEYKSWPLGKQRGAEWKRAAKVRKILLQIIKNSEKFTEKDVWSTKRILTWSRKHGYAVSDIVDRDAVMCEICGYVKIARNVSRETKYNNGKRTIRNNEEKDESDEDMEDDGEEEEEEKEEEEIENHECKITWLNESGYLANPSLSTCDDLCQNIQKQQSELKVLDSDSDVEVDVLSITDNRKLQIKKELSDTEGTVQMYLPSTLHTEYVQNAVQEIGVKLPPVEVSKDTFAPVMEEMLLTAMIDFMNDLLRDSLSVAHGNKTDNRCPGQVLPVHVYQAVLNQSKYSFLTNKHLGVVPLDKDNAGTKR